jgi:TolA-binding protein
VSERIALLLLSHMAMSAACSAPSQLSDLIAAEQHERAGRDEQALAAYAAAQSSCRKIAEERRRRASCAAAYLRRAELLASMGRAEQAIVEFARIPEAVPDDEAAAAQANLRAGELSLRLGHEREAYTFLWRTVTNYPDEAFAADALRVVLRDGRRKNAKELAAELVRIYPALATTQVADNILYSLADLSEHEFGNPAAALAYLDQLLTEHKDSGLRDDAFWHGARLARQLGDAKGAVKRLKGLLATREVAWGAGSYFSIWLDDAQLELGRVLRDDLGDRAGALAAFAKLPVDYPASILIDDALFETAVTWAGAGDAARACAVLADLGRRFPDSKYQLERAPALAKQMNCAQKKQPKAAAP